MKKNRPDEKLNLNLELAEAIALPDFDCDSYVALALRSRRSRQDLVDLTAGHPHIMVYYHGYYILDRAAEKKPDLFYPYWPVFAELLHHRNTYHRQIGITLLARLSGADPEDRFDGILENYLERLYDEKILIGTLTAGYLKIIIRNKPEHRNRIIEELLGHRNKSRYTERQEALLEYEILEILDEYYGTLPGKDRIDAYIRERKNSDSPKTRKKARELIKKRDIPSI